MPNSQNKDQESARILSKDELADTYRKILGSSNCWVLFKNGTCIQPREKTEDISSKALELLAKYGPIQTGTPASDFNIMSLTGIEGWIVTCGHPDIVNYISPRELGPNTAFGDGHTIELLSRLHRDSDTKNPIIIHVEDEEMIYTPRIK
ncbi:MAG: hypothetical protein RIQ72_161 [Candidatus Parcubacteria bacterium]|jgi:hypothetical protein